jgi:hypothetical protein
MAESARSMCDALHAGVLEARATVLLALLLFTASFRQFLPQASHLAENPHRARKRFNKRTSVLSSIAM